MSEQVLEQLSAFMDGELPAAEERLLLARLERDPALRAAWERYHMVSDVMRDALPRQRVSVADRVMAELDQVPTPRRRRVSGWLKPAVGVAVAASVAMVAVISLPQNHGAMPSEVVPGLSNSSGQSLLAPGAVKSAAWEQVQPETRNQLNRYLMQHTQHSSRRPIQGMFPYAHIAVYESQAPRDANTQDKRDAQPPRAEGGH